MEQREAMDSIRKAIADGNMTEANRILDTNQNIIKQLTSFNGTLLHDAVRYNQLDLANRLIDMGIDINVKCPGSAFRGLAINLAKTKDMAELLLRKGVVPELNLDDFSYNPISFKVEHDEMEMFLFWLEYEKSKFNSEEQELLLKQIERWAKVNGSKKILKYLNVELKKESKPAYARQAGALSTYKSLAGIWGIPEFMPPDGGGDFQSKKQKKNKSVLDEFEKQLLEITKKIYASLSEKYTDIYAFSLVCTNEFDYIYYVANTEEYYLKTKKVLNIDLDKRYNEDEWEIAIDQDKELEKLSQLLKKVVHQNEESEELVVRICIEVMKKLRDNNYFPNTLLINVHIWEYFLEDELLDIYVKLNGEDKRNEYQRFLFG